MRFYQTYKNRIYWLCLSALSYVTITSCGRHHDDENSSTNPPAAPNPPLIDPPAPTPAEIKLSEEDFSWWLQKSNNTIRFNEPLSEFTSKLDVHSMKWTDVAKKMADDPAFYDMLTDFSMYWFGVKGGKFWDRDYRTQERLISSNVGEFQQIINGVLAVAKGGDYFKGLFSESGLNVINYYNQPSLERGTSENMSAHDIRVKLMEGHHEEIKALKLIAEKNSKKDFCDRWNDSSKVGHLSNISYQIGGPDRVARQLIERGSYQDFENWCFSEEITAPKDMAQKLDEIESTVKSIVPKIEKIEATFNGHNPRYAPHVMNLTRFNFRDFDLEEKPYFNEALFQKLPNSSTNRNRRRASWVLKRFFCDDLTPINVEIPSSHSTNQHGSDPACYSCHYKLDPMAGYFRELGFFGRSFASSESIFFDDGATALRKVYEKDWQADPNSGRAWNIGYIRSTVDSSLNTYGSNFSELMTLLQTAPEVRECFVKRVFEYVVGEEQTADRAWLQSMAAQMAETSKTSPQEAIKSVFVSVITSKAFITRDRSNNECYDLVPGSKPEGRPPCRIASVLEHQCASCHTGRSAAGGLDVTKWIKIGDEGFGFLHVKGGKQVPRGDSFASIRSRLNSSDSNLRMPLMKTMPASEREELFLFLERELAKKH